MKFLLLFSLLLYCATSFAQQPGTLDPSFGNKGTILEQSPITVIGETIKVAKDGRIFIGTIGPYKGFAFTFRIDALLPDGSADLSFGDNGSTYVIFPGMTKPSNTSGITSLALLPDGRILAGGSLDASGTKDDIAFAQLKPDGTLDSSFGINGTATASFGYTNEGAVQITIQSDGKIVSVGCISFGEFSVARFLPNGMKDINFGDKGLVVGKDKGYASAVTVQKDGKIVVTGYTGIPNTETTHFHTERYNVDGSYDNSFGVKGVIDAQIGSGGSVAKDITVQEDGKLVVAGTSNGPFNLRFTVVRYNTDGSLDKSFGQDGAITNTFSQYSEAKKVFITGEESDKIVVVGSASPDGSGYNFAIVGYNIDGSLDQDFGNKGIQTTNFNDLTATVTSADIQPNGNIISLGYTQSSQPPFDAHRALARYFGYPTKVPLAVRIKRFIRNHSITWNGLPADDKIASYSVEQSNSSRTGFTPIAKLSGRSNLHDYSFTNSQLLQGANYYRIKAVSTDGTIRYSEVVSADNSTNTASVFPNPAKSYVTVQGLATDATANISIKDGSGTIVQRSSSSGSTQYRSSVSNLLPGTYYLNITTAGKTETLPFVKE